MDSISMRMGVEAGRNSSSLGAPVAGLAGGFGPDAASGTDAAEPTLELAAFFGCAGESAARAPRTSSTVPAASRATQAITARGAP